MIMKQISHHGYMIKTRILDQKLAYVGQFPQLYGRLPWGSAVAGAFLEWEPMGQAVGGWATLLKNTEVIGSQLEWWNSQYMEEEKCSKPPTRICARRFLKSIDWKSSKELKDMVPMLSSGCTRTNCCRSHQVQVAIKHWISTGSGLPFLYPSCKRAIS